MPVHAAPYPTNAPYLVVTFVGQPMAALRLGQCLTVNDTPLTLGRSSSNTVQVDLPDLSRRHAGFLLEADRYYVEDFASRNGTFVNRERIPPGSRRALDDGDEINLANLIILQYYDPNMTREQGERAIVLPAGLLLDPEQQQVYIRRQRLEPPLTPQQYRFLAALYAAPGRVVNRNELIAAAWHAADGVSDAAIDATAHRVRSRLAELDPGSLIASLSEPSRRPDLESWMAGRDVLDALRSAPEARLDAAEFGSLLRPLQPRLYSISSSPKAHPGEVHLTVGTVRYEAHGRARLGVASCWLADRVIPGVTPVPVFVQVSRHFRPPGDPSRPMIMVGPGTGIAPFRAFLQERRAIGATGKHWLFFGDQRRATDYLYSSELDPLHQDGFLTRVVVQNPLIDQGLVDLGQQTLPGFISAADGVLRNVVPTLSHPFGHTLYGHIRRRQAQKKQLHPVAECLPLRNLPRVGPT